MSTVAAMEGGAAAVDGGKERARTLIVGFDCEFARFEAAFRGLAGTKRPSAGRRPDEEPNGARFSRAESVVGRFEFDVFTEFCFIGFARGVDAFELTFNRSLTEPVFCLFDTRDFFFCVTGMERKEFRTREFRPSDAFEGRDEAETVALSPSTSSNSFIKGSSANNTADPPLLILSRTIFPVPESFAGPFRL